MSQAPHQAVRVASTAIPRICATTSQAGPAFFRQDTDQQPQPANAAPVAPSSHGVRWVIGGAF